MSKLKEQAPAILVTAAIMGLLLTSYAYYVNAKVLPAQRQELEALRTAQAADLERSALETRREISSLNKLLQDAVAARAGGLFHSEEEATVAENAKIAQLAEAVAQKLNPSYHALPKTPEEAEALQNAQVDKVSGRLADRIQPILGQIASDQNLTRESLTRYAEQISQQVSGVLGSELARNERLGTQIQLTQSLAQESVALSSELTALYLSSIKDQGVLNRILLLPANIVRDASNFSLLNNDQRRAKEAELTKRLRDIQSRLDAARTATDATIGVSATTALSAEAAPGTIVVEPVAPPVRLAPTRPTSAE